MVTILGAGDAFERRRGKVLAIRCFGNPVIDNRGIEQSGDRAVGGSTQGRSAWKALLVQPSDQAFMCAHAVATGAIGTTHSKSLNRQRSKAGLGHKETVATGRSGAPEFLLFTAHKLVLTCLRRIEKPRVGGSIPPQATRIIKHLAQPVSGWAFLLVGHVALCRQILMVRLP
jgi:hypothetical protein